VIGDSGLAVGATGSAAALRGLASAVAEKTNFICLRSREMHASFSQSVAHVVSFSNRKRDAGTLWHQPEEERQSGGGCRVADMDRALPKRIVAMGLMPLDRLTETLEEFHYE
jgi:hypothetical protein